jgi:hypothetical protein
MKNQTNLDVFPQRPLDLDQPRHPTSTPWGEPQSVTPLGYGAFFISTASHGGFYVPPELLEKVPGSFKFNSYGGQGYNGWFEEDCDAALLVVALPELFPGSREEAIRDMERALPIIKANHGMRCYDTARTLVENYRKGLR